jgi:hypothetical protein
MVPRRIPVFYLHPPPRSGSLNFGTPTYRSVKQILSNGFDLQSELAEFPALEAPYLGAGRFSRSGGDRMH